MESSKSLTLKRTRFCEDGIFGELRDDTGGLVAYTLEHSYNDVPKLTPGVHTCVRGPHRLHGMTEDFSTFEITGVAGHSGILFHWGNWNKDSDGCVLLGLGITPTMVTDSRKAFEAFMARFEGINSFELRVC